MKTALWSIALLAVIAILCWVNTAVLSDITDAETQLLAEAEKLADAGRWEDAAGICEKAKAYWEERRTYLGTVLCHSESDQITDSFGPLLALAAHEDLEDFASLTAEMTAHLEHIKEMELPLIANIL